MKKLILTLALTAAGAATVPAAQIFIDFGAVDQPSTGNINNVTPAQLPITDLIDDTGTNTGIQLTTIGFNPGSNASGTLTPTGTAAIFGAQATRDNLFGHTATFGTTPPLPLATLTFSGLDSGSVYTFDFFASRMSAGGDNRSTLYTVTGMTSDSEVLNASENTSNLASVFSIAPDGTGSIKVDITKDSTNTNGTGFFYLGALRMTSAPVPEPTSALFAGTAALMALRRRRAGA